MKFTNKKNLPQQIVAAAYADMYDKGDAYMSVTELLSHPRPRLLALAHPAQEVDISENLHSMLGTAFHMMMEKASEFETGVMCEERVSVEMLGHKISGQIDRQRIDEKGNLHIVDYKVTSYNGVRDRVKKGIIKKQSALAGCDSWVQQTNCYAYMAHKTKNLNIASITVIVFIRDWTKVRMAKDPSYPTSPIMVLKIPVYSMGSVHKFMTDRLKMHLSAQADFEMTGALPECTVNDMWGGVFTYSPQARRSVVAETLADAMRQQASLGVPFSVSATQALNCTLYCNVRDICPTPRAMQERLKAETAALNGAFKLGRAAKGK